MTTLAALTGRAVSAYRNTFDSEPTDIVQAPGRVNLIGEHTDYNDGFVLPCAINCWTVIATGPATRRVASTVAVDLDNEFDHFDLAQPITREMRGTWRDHVRGVAAMLQADGIDLAGINIAVAGNVPQGAGLSSSASLGVALGLALTRANAAKGYGPTELAKIAQRSENDFVGCRCGIMDQMASAHGQSGTALLLDCRSLEITPITMPVGAAILVIHSGISRGLVDSAYNERRAQCEAAANHFGVAALRDVTSAQLLSAHGALSDVILRRARHVVSENERTVAAATALHNADLYALGDLMRASHHSMRDDFEITLPAIDDLVSMITGLLGGNGGARMTGGGFGGCIVAILPDAIVQSVTDHIARHYRTPTGAPPAIYRFYASNGSSAVTPL